MAARLREDTERFWAELLKVYRDQVVISHRKAAKAVGVERHRAARLYHSGSPKYELMPIKEVLLQEQAQARADRYRLQVLTNPATLEDAQEDARQVAIVEGQMISAVRFGTAKLLRMILPMVDALDPLSKAITRDIRKMAKDKEATPEDRRALMREVMAYLRSAADVVERVMALERKLLNEPAAVLGADMTADVGDLARRAMESAKALMNTAQLIDVTPDGGVTKH